MNLLRAPKPSDIPQDAADFLRQLKVSTIIEIPGLDDSRNRTLATLSHGNESSGFKALHKWLREGRTPTVDITVVLGGVEAALKEPLFYYRHLPDQRDFNRCFHPPYDDSQGRKAQAVLERIQKDRPEALVDMHNTSGATPAFAVSCGRDSREQALAGIFVDTLLVSELRMGALMEADIPCPVVTVEVGGSEDPGSLTVAQKGLEHFFCDEYLFSNPRSVSLIKNPMRLELKISGRLTHGDGPLDDSDVVLRDDIESLNFTPLGRDEHLGWVGERGASHLRIRTKDGTCGIEDYFTIQESRLYPKSPVILFMATLRDDIAVSDCLFYFVRDGD